MCVYVIACMHVCVRACMCVCVWKRERERDRDRERERHTHTDRQTDTQRQRCNLRNVRMMVSSFRCPLSLGRKREQRQFNYTKVNTKDDPNSLFTNLSQQAGLDIYLKHKMNLIDIVN